MLRWFLLSGLILISCFQDSPPEISITFPSDGEKVTGSVIIQAIATDDVALKLVEFLIDDTPIGSDTSRPYYVYWETDSIEDQSSHKVTAVAYDKENNSATDSLFLTIDHSLKPPKITKIDTAEVRSTSLWLNWETEDAESIFIFRSLSPRIDTIQDLIISLPNDSTQYHDLWLLQDFTYFYLLIAKDSENLKAVSPLQKIRTAQSLTITWLLNSNAVPGWIKDGDYYRASSAEELRMIIGDSANPYIANGFIDFTLQPYKGEINPPDTNFLMLYLFDMEDSINAKAVYDSVDPGNTTQWDTVGDEARYLIDAERTLMDFRRRNGFVRITLDSNLPEAFDVVKIFAIYVDNLIL